MRGLRRHGPGDIELDISITNRPRRPRLTSQQPRSPARHLEERHRTNGGRASSGDSRPASSAYLPQRYLTRRHPPTPHGCLYRGKSPVKPHSHPLPGQRERQRTLSVSHPLTPANATRLSVSRKSPVNPHSRPLPGQRERQRTLSVSDSLTPANATWLSVSRKESG